MRFTKFKIKNYKGIQDITLNMIPEGANIFTLIGLNESGKTSILEAISLFNPALTEENEEFKKLYSTSIEKIDPVKLIPKHSKSNFNEKIEVSATLNLSSHDKIEIMEHINNNKENSYTIDSLDDDIVISQVFEFSNSDYIKRQTYVTF